MGQDGSKLSSKRRVEHAEKVRLLSKEKQAAMKLSSSEINTLKQLYHRLAALSPEDEYINKETFLNYFPLEGVLAERLFATFDRDKNNVIDYEEFLGGLALCLAGTVDDKFQLVFDLYNIDDGDGITEEELAIVLKSTLMAAKAIVEPIENTSFHEDVVKDSFDVDQHVKNVVHDAFEQCDTSQTGKLSPEEFRNWAEKHSYILDIIFSHKSFTDKQKISENITAAAMKAAEINSVRCQTQTWIDSPNSTGDLAECYGGYNQATYLWSPVFPVMLNSPKARSEHSACVYQGALYVLGGRGTCAAFKDFWKYDLALNNWSEIPSVGERPTLIFGHTAIVHKGCMYVYGGEFESCETFVWKYIFERNEWEKITSDNKESTSDNKTPMNRRYHSAVVYNKKMYIFGGLIEIRGSSDELWSFDFAEHTWQAPFQRNPAGPGKRYEHSATVYSRSMWIVGGLAIFTPRNDVWKWEFENSVWCKIKNKGGPFPIRGHRVVRCGNGMLVYGGATNGEHQDKIWRFEFESQRWSLVSPQGGVSPPARTAAAVVILSTFALPLLPPQMINATQTFTTSGKFKTNTLVDEVRPHSSPVSNEKTTSSNERRFRQWSSSRDSLHQLSSITWSDRRSSAGSMDKFGDNFISFTNLSYRRSPERKIGTSNIHPSRHKTFDRSCSLERHEEESPQSEDITKVNGISSCSPLESLTLGDRHETERNMEFSQPKEGLCVFAIGGKSHISHEVFCKGLDIWRCDVTKCRKRSDKIRRIKVQTAKTVAPSTKTDNSLMTFHEQSNKLDDKFPSAKAIYTHSSTQSFSSCRQDVPRTSGLHIDVGNQALTANVESYHHGDLVITDLACSGEPLVDD